MQEIGVSMIGLIPGKPYTCAYLEAQVYSHSVLQYEALRPDLSCNAFFGIAMSAWSVKY